MAAFDRIGSGIPALDAALDSIRLGDNVVWRVSDLSQFRLFMEPYVDQAIRDHRDIIYFRFANHEPLITGLASEMDGSVSGHIRANWFVPDPRCWWIKPSVRYLSKLIENGERFDAVISTGPPHSMHLIAKEIHKKFNIPWLADFRDPWTKIFYFKHLGLSAKSLRKHKELERSVLTEADLATVVSSQMEKEFSEGEYIAFKDKVKTIPNGYDPDDFEPVSEAGGADGKFVVAHTGLMPESANPDKLWKVLGDLIKSDPDFKEKLMVVTWSLPWVRPMLP